MIHTLTDLVTALSGITGFLNKVAFHSFPADAVPEMPYLVYIVPGTDTTAADNKVYYAGTQIQLELYTEIKDLAKEALVEAKLAELEIVWESSESRIETEQCYQKVYTFTI